MSVGRVSLAYRDLTELPASFMTDLAKFCRVLDLTSNMITYEPLQMLIYSSLRPLLLTRSFSRFRDLQPLRDLPLLEELILDDNKITSHTKFPPLPKLQTLWVNRNQITHLTLFIDKLVASCPDLIMLSALNNEACPNYFNAGTPTQYQDYRYAYKVQFGCSRLFNRLVAPNRACAPLLPLDTTSSIALLSFRC